YQLLNACRSACGNSGCRGIEDQNINCRTVVRVTEVVRSRVCSNCGCARGVAGNRDSVISIWKLRLVDLECPLCAVLRCPDFVNGAVAARDVSADGIAIDNKDRRAVRSAINAAVPDKALAIIERFNTVAAYRKGSINREVQLHGSRVR